MGVYLSQPNKDKHIVEGKGSGLNFVSAEMQGSPADSQDAAIHNPDIGDGNSLFAVFDGHGGCEVSRYVAKIFTRQLMGNALYKSGKFGEALDLTFKRVDEILQQPEGQKELNRIREGREEGEGGGVGQQKPQYIGGAVGCTANVILITPKTFYVANAGDSRSVLCRQGKAVALSEDHKPDSSIEQARIKKAGGVISMGRVNGGLNLTRSLGDFDYKRVKNLGYDEQMITCKPDVKQFQRKKEDEFILLGCDGIWQNYVQNNQGIIDIVKQDIKTKTTKKVVQDLLERLVAPDTISGIGCDNMTAVLIVFKN